MKRSEINTILRNAEKFIQDHKFYLPPFAFWSVEQWQSQYSNIDDLVSVGMGWDITDFGSGDFEKMGLVLFTIRNGKVGNLRSGVGKTYAEKLLIVNESQLTPLHFHWQKTEDIINRAGGVLAIKLYNSNGDETLSDDNVVVQVDGISREVEAGGVIYLNPGESVTLPTHLYHAFWAEGSPVLAGEVSQVNDDTSDNKFYNNLGRFPQIIEDEAPYRLLVGDYSKTLGF